MVIALQVHVLYFNNYINCEIRLLVHVYPGECELGTQSFTYTRKSYKLMFTILQKQCIPLENEVCKVRITFPFLTLLSTIFNHGKQSENKSCTSAHL